MNGILIDLRLAIRMLLKRPLFTVVATTAIALGIGATTSIFSLANALLLRELPVADPASLATVTSVAADGSGDHAFSYPVFRELRDRNRTFSSMASVTDGFVSFSAGGEPERLYCGIVGGDFFRVLGIDPAVGRFFSRDEDRVAGALPVAVISHDLWRLRFGGRRSVVGRSVLINGHRFTIVGVAPDRFIGLRTGIATAIWLPSAMQSIASPNGLDVLEARNVRGVQIVGRVAPGIELRKADADLEQILARSKRLHQHEGVYGVLVERAAGMSGEAREGVTRFMAVLVVVALLVLLIASLDVASMLSSRAIARRREIAVRLAIGAGRARIIRQLLIESVVLSLAGAAAGVLVAVWANDLLLAFKPPIDLPIELDVSIDSTVLFVTLGVAIVIGILFGLSPAIGAARTELSDSLKESATAVRRGRSRLRRAFIVVQVGLSLVLLITSGLFLRTLQRAVDAEVGFDSENVEVVEIDPALHGYDEQRAHRLFDALLERVRSHPDVESAAASKTIPLSLSSTITSVFMVGETEAPSVGHQTDVTMISTDYFRTLRIPLLSGRDFEPGDRAEAAPVAIVNQEMARRYWHNDAIGRKFSTSGPDGPWIEVIGVVATGQYGSIGEDPKPFLYLPINQSPPVGAHILVRRRHGAPSLIPIVRREFRALDVYLPLAGAASLESYMSMSLMPQRVAAGVAGAFGLLGLVLASVGIYGLVAYSVADRARELGIRTAIGASRRQLFTMVVRQSMMPVGAGILTGLAGSLALTRLLTSFLLGLSATDATTFVGVPALLALVALVATVVPAARVLRIDPMSAIRYE